MSRPDQSRPSDRNLLFGLLALQMDFISRDALIEGMQAWVLDKQKTLGELLVERGALSASRRQLLEPLVDEHVRQHGGDAQQSLAAVSSVSQVAEKLQDIADSDLQQSLAHVAAPLSSEVGAFSQVQTLEQPPQASVSASAPQAHESDEFAAEFKLTLLQDSQESRPQAGRFLLLRPHAEGGLGKVWVAKDRELNREVAFKEIKAGRAQDRNSRGRFILEAEVTGGLEHPGIVPVYGLGHFDDGRPFYAMRFIRGHSLREAIQRFHRPVDGAGQRPVVSTVTGDLEHSLEFRKLLQRLIDVCNAIAYAHSRGVLHRDLKPDNIMLGKYGETLVVDWGLAKVKGESLDTSASEDVTDSIGPEPHLSASGSGSGEEMTPTHGAVGTPLFMSPEQAAGRLDELGAATDIYSLGATLYELLTGQAPIGAAADSQREKLSLPEVLRRAQAGEFPAPRSVLPAVPAALEAVCLKAMSLKPSARYASANDLAADLERWLAGDPVSACQEPINVRAMRWCRKHPALVSFVTAALLMAAVGLAIGFIVVTGKNSELDEKNSALITATNEAKTQQAIAIANEERAEKSSHLANVRLYATQIASAQREMENRDHGLARIRLDQTEPEFRAWEYAYLDRVNALKFTLKGHLGATQSVSFSPDGKRIVSGSWDGTVKVWDAATGQETLTLTGRLGTVNSVSFSPDGKRIVSGSDNTTLKVWDAATGEETLTLKGHSNGVNRVSYSPDGERIVSGSNDHTVKVWEAATGHETLTLEGHSNAVLSVSFSPDGKWIVSGSFDKSIKVWDAATGEETLTLTGHSRDVNSVSFSPDGKRIVSGSDDNTVKVWDAVTGQETLTLKGHSGDVNSVSFSPDGKRIVSGSEDKTVKIWDAATGQETLTLKGHSGYVWGVSFNPDGQRIVSGSSDNTVKVWDAATDQHTITLDSHSGRVRSLSFNLDGKRIVSATWGETVRVWDAATGQETLILKGHSGGVWSVSFSSDGKRIVSGGGRDDKVRVWDAATGEETLTLKGQSGGNLSVNFSPDGKRIVSGGGRDDTVRGWDATTGQETLTLKGHSDGVTSVSFSPDGKRIVSGSWDETVKVWDAATGQETLTLKGHLGWVSSVSFSPDGKRIVSGSWDNTLKVWDVATGQETLTLNGHSGSVLSVSFSPDGQRIISGMEDGTIKIWDAGSGARMEPVSR